MAQLLEYQAKQLLKAQGIAVPRGGLAQTLEGCLQIADEIGYPVAVKAQVSATNRAGAGLIRFANCPQDMAPPSGRVLVEQRVEFTRELYLGYIVDDRRRSPLLLLSAVGGTGIEERLASIVTLPVSVTREPTPSELEGLTEKAGVPPEVAGALMALYRMARCSEARSAEINPLAVTAQGRLIALDSRVSVDDYAVFRHPELGIDIAREFSHTPTELDRIAWLVEKDDYRGTFYFAEMDDSEAQGRIPVGFHGAGGGGSMSSLDAAQNAGLRIANYADLSGNPPASKVYRAARIILSQPGVRGYFCSGSGVASQEQFHIARGLVKAFREQPLSIPAVLRLGGNGEELAGRIIARYVLESGAQAEAYTKNDGTDDCAKRLRELIEAAPPARTKPRAPRTEATQPYSFKTRTGRITFDHALCAECETKACVTECGQQILQLTDGLPVLNILEEEARRGRCIECLACEVECWYQGKSGASIDLPIFGLAEYVQRHGHTD